jgi:hypothetical protein
MARVYVFWMLVLLTGLIFGSATADKPNPQTIKGWGTVVDPERDRRVTEEGGKVTVTVAKTYHDLTHFDGETKLNALRNFARG